MLPPSDYEWSVIYGEQDQRVARDLESWPDALSVYFTLKKSAEARFIQAKLVYDAEGRLDCSKTVVRRGVLVELARERGETPLFLWNDLNPQPKPGKGPAAFYSALELLFSDLESRALKVGQQFSREKMPGIKANLQEIAAKFDPVLDGLTLRTFDDYIQGRCRFGPGARSTAFYRDLFPEFFKM
jgi:hypothetical protein